MQVKSVRKGHAMQTITFNEVSEVNDEALIQAALSATGEVRECLHGINVTYFIDDEPEFSAAVVTLWTD